MGSAAQPRKVLIIEDEPAIRNVLFVLLAGGGCEGHVAYDVRQGLGMIQRGSFDAVLLDLRSTNMPPADEIIPAITKLRPSLVGRVLIITGEVADPETLGTLERYALPHVPRSKIISDLWNHLRSLAGFTESHAGSTP